MKKQFTNKVPYLGLKLTAIIFALLLITSGSVWAATETLNCPAGTIVNSTMTFNTTNFTIVHSKAADANFASYTPWRVYTNNTVSITGGSGVSSITSIVIYTSSSAYANAVNGSLTVTGGGSASASVSGNNCTITITGTATALLIDPSAQTRWSQIDINYSAASSCTALGTPTVTPTAGNTQATLSWDAVTNASSYTLIWNGGSAETVTSPVTKTGLINGTSYSYSVMAVGDGTTYCATNTAATGNVTPTAPIPTITLNLTTLTGFTYVAGSGPSAEQTFTVSGANLTNNISIASSTNYEISKTTATGFTTPLTFTPAEVAIPQTVFVRLKAGLSTASYNSEVINLTSTGADAKTVTCSGSVTAPPTPEPSNHATSFGAVTGTPTYSAIIVSWTDATGSVVPDGYLIKGSSVSYGSITDPVDGTAEANGGLVKNITQGTGIYEFTGLSASTHYYFKIYPYTNSGSSINYKTDATIPQTTATTDAPASVKWDGGASTSAWTDAANWNNNVVPSVTDEVILDNSLLAGSYSVTLPTGAVKTTIKKLTITPTLPNTITLTLPVGNTYGASNDAGFVVGDNTASTDDIIINEGGVLVNASGGSTGNGIQVNALANGTLRINNGGKFIHNTSRSAAGSSAAAILSTATGTEYGIYEYDIPGTGSYAFGASGRTYGSLILSRTSGAATYTSTGSSSLIIRGDFTMNSGITYTSGMTGSMSIGRNLINNGTTLTIPVGQAVNFNGSSSQDISGTNSISLLGTTTITNTTGITLSQNATFNNLTIDAGSIFSIASGKQLTVTGTLTNNGGTAGLVLKSDATGTASLINSTAGVNATVERYITHYTSNTDGWRLVSSPVNAAAIGNFAPGTNDDFYGYDEANNLWINYKVSPFGFTNGLGYLSSYETSATKSFSGALNTADVTITNLSLTPTKGNGWQLLGNPYASAIKWNDGNWTLSNVNTTAKRLNNGGTYTDLAANDIIPSMNGFFVQVSNATNSIKIPAASRTHSSANILNKSSVAERLDLKVSSIGNNTYVEATIKTNANATNGFDTGYDANFLAGMYGAPQLYSIVANGNLSTNSIPTISGNIAIPLGFVPGIATNYSFSADGLANFSHCTSITLEDLKTNTTQNLMQNPVYNFTATTTDNANRFVLHFDTSVGVNEIGKTNGGIYAYDNSIYVNANEQIKQIRVYNAMGQLVKTLNNVNGLQKINMNGNATGYYIVRVVSDKNVYSEKVLVK